MAISNGTVLALAAGATAIVVAIIVAPWERTEPETPLDDPVELAALDSAEDTNAADEPAEQDPLPPTDPEVPEVPAEETPVAAGDAPPAIVAPAFELVRIEPDGTGLVAGKATAGMRIAILLDDQTLIETVADANGQFVDFLTLDASAKPRMLSLLADPEGEAVASEETIIISPTAVAPPVVADLGAEAGDEAPAPASSAEADEQSAPDPATDPADAPEDDAARDTPESEVAAADDASAEVTAPDAAEAMAPAEAEEGDLVAADEAVAGDISTDLAAADPADPSVAPAADGVESAENADTADAGDMPPPANVAAAEEDETRDLAKPELAGAEGDPATDSNSAAPEAAPTEIAEAETTEGAAAETLPAEPTEQAAPVDPEGTAGDAHPAQVDEGGHDPADAESPLVVAEADDTAEPDQPLANPAADSEAPTELAEAVAEAGEDAPSGADPTETAPEAAGQPVETAAAEDEPAEASDETAEAAPEPDELPEIDVAEAGEPVTAPSSEVASPEDGADPASTVADAADAPVASPENETTDGEVEQGESVQVAEAEASTAPEQAVDEATAETADGAEVIAAVEAPEDADTPEPAPDEPDAPQPQPDTQLDLALADPRAPQSPAIGSVTTSADQVEAPQSAAEVAQVALPEPAAPSGEPAPAPSVDANAPRVAQPEALSPATPPLLIVDNEGVRVLQSAPSDPSGPGSFATVALDTITYDETGEVLVSGRASAGAAVRLYLDNAPVTDVLTGDDGTWTTPLTDVTPGVYTLRADQLGADGSVASRIETPFLREERAAIAAAMAEETADEDFSLAVRTVQPGNTLWAIAREKYGRGILYVAVFEANKDQIRNPDLIYPGQIFNLPDIEDPDGYVVE